jgi:hypothetical protein
MTPFFREWRSLARVFLGVLISSVAATDTMAQVIFAVSPDTALAQRIAPGGSGRLTLTAHNDQANSAVAWSFGLLFSDIATFSEYSFVADQPTVCNPPVVTPQTYWNELDISSSPIAPGADVTCSYTMTRSQTSRSDLVFSLCPTAELVCFYPWFFVGTLPDRSLQAEPTTPASIGSRSLTFRVTASNPSPHEIAATSIGTDCAEFFVGGTLTAPFDVENDFPGACPTSDESVLCANFTGQDAISKGFRIGPIPAGGTASCLLRARFWQPLSRPLSLGLQYVAPWVPDETGGIGYDPDTSNDRAVLDAGPTGTGDAPMGVPIDDRAYALLLVVIGTAGSIAARLGRRQN